MNQADIFKELIRYYRLEKPVPIKVHKDLLQARRETLIAILKKQGKYGLFILLVMNLFFFGKRIGISMSIIKCTIIVWTISLTTAGVITLSAYYIARNILSIEPHPIKEQLQEEQVREKIVVKEKVVEDIEKKITFVNITKKDGEIIKGQIISNKNGIISIRNKSGNVIKIDIHTIWKIRKQ